jgi:hypothetical protein
MDHPVSFGEQGKDQGVQAGGQVIKRENIYKSI